MFSVSERWKRAVLYGGNLIAYVDIVDDAGQFVLSNLPVTAGQVTVDRTRAIRRECSITIQDQTGLLVPQEIDDILQPLSGYYMRLYKGYRYYDGQEEVIPLGTFAPWDPKVSESPGTLQITVQGFDRSKLISLIRWTEPYVINAKTNTAVAVREALLSRMSNLSMLFRPTETTTPLTTFGTTTDNNDPWKDISGLASADGMELYFDANDVVRFEPAAEDPDVYDPVMVFAEGPTCTITKLDRSNDASQQYTGVIVRSESSQIIPPIKVEVWRTDTPYRIPYFFTSSLITTYAQAVNAALARLRVSGRGEISCSFTAVPDASLEVDDVIRITSTKSRVDDRFIVSSMTMPLDSTSAMTVNTSQRRLP